jgi:hypothetical protein
MHLWAAHNTIDSSECLNLLWQIQQHNGFKQELESVQRILQIPLWIIQVRAWICLKEKFSTLWNSPRLSFFPFSCNKDCTWNGFMWFLASINPSTHTLAACVQTSVSTRFH